MSRPSALRSKVNYSRYGYYFVAPFVIAFLIFQLYSIFFTFRISFSDMSNWNMNFSSVGLQNFRMLFSFAQPVSRLFWGSIRNTAIIWIVNFVPQITLALLLSHWFTSMRLRLRFVGGLKVLIFLPNMITAATIAVLFYSLFNFPVAPVNTVLQQFGLISAPFDFYRSVGASRGIISFIQFWMWYGNTMIIMVAGISGISPDLFEAGMVDGGTSGQLFYRITLPLLRPILLYTLVTSMIGGLQIFDIPHLLTRGNPNNTTETAARFIYRQAFTGTFNFNMAAAASVVVFCIIVLLSIVLFIAMRDRSEKRRRAR